MSEAVVAAPESPYKGLAPFEDSDLDALLFFGREREREIIGANLQAYRLTVLYGASGVGKSSVLRAGVAHELRRRGEVVAVFGAWSGDPIAGLLATVRDAVVERFGPDSVGAGGRLADSLSAWSQAHGSDLYVIFDQFDEYFLYHDDDDVFAEQFAEAATADLRANFVVAIRDDMLSKLDRFKARIPNLFSNYLRLDHLDAQAARSAIVGPVDEWNRLTDSHEQVQVEPALVDAVLAQTAAGRVAIAEGDFGEPTTANDRLVEAPYLQLVLQRLWEEERAAGSASLRIETLERLHGAEEIVRAHLREALDALSASEQDLAADVFNHLVTPSGTKIAHGLGDLAEYARVPEHALVPVLSALVDDRIVRPVEETGRPEGSRYEIFHDVLAEPVSAWRAAHAADQRLEQQRRDAERRHRRLLAITGVALLAVAAMALLTVFAFAQRREARKQAGIASIEKEKAQGQKQKAQEQTALAKQNLKEAKTQTKRAEESEKDLILALEEAEQERQKAETSQTAAEAAQKEAESAADEAKASKAKAESAKKSAIREKEHAQDNLALARRNAKKAARETETARRQTRLARNRSRERHAARLISRSLGLLTVDPERSLKDAVLAAKIDRNPAVEAAIRAALVATNGRAVFRGGGGPTHAKLSRDGSLVLVAGTRQARVFETRSRRLVRAIRPGSDISAADLSPDGQLVVTAANERVIVWRIATGTPLHATPLLHAGAVNDTSFSNDGKQLVTASDDRSVRLWDVSSGLLLRSFANQLPAASAELSRDGTRVVAVPSEGAGRRPARLFDVRDEREIAALAHPAASVASAGFSPDSNLVVTTGGRGARIWSARIGQLNLSLPQAVGGAAVKGAFSADSKLVVIPDRGSQARVYDTRTGALTTVLSGHEKGVVDASFDSAEESARLIVTAGDDGTARVWRESGYPTSVLRGHTDKVTSATFEPGGDTVVTTSLDGTARVWDPHGAEPLLRRLDGHSKGAVTSVLFSPNGKLAVSAGDDDTALISRIRGGRVATLRHRKSITAIDVAGDFVVTASADGTARIWRWTGALVRILDHGAPVTAMAATSGAEIVATADARGVIRLWRNGRLYAERQHGGPVTSASVDRRGGRLVTASRDDTARIWRLVDGRLLHTLRGHTDDVLDTAFSPTGRYVATASRDDTARIWDARTGKLHKVLRRHTKDVTSLNFNYRGTRLLTVSEDEDARIWVVRTGEPLALLRGHSFPIADAAFSFDGRWVVTASARTAALWETATGRRIFFFGRTPFPRAVAFSTRGWRILTGGADGAVRTYDCRICPRLPGLVALGKARLRNLRPAG